MTLLSLRFCTQRETRAPWIGAGLLLLLVTVAYLFWPATRGPFVFDDFPNLQNLAELQGTPDLPHIKRYLAAFNGNPGRPLATLSFVIEDATWPTDPASYKRNNILWHLLTGVLVFALVRRLAQLLPALAPIANGTALLTAAMWLLHPIQLSATMLVVQRMNILSSIFMLSGLLMYLASLRNQRVGEMPRVILAGLVLGVFGGLAMLCKENGILVFAYATAINLTVLRPSLQAFKPLARRLLLAGAALPLILLAAMAAWFHDIVANGYASRDFTLGERLLTQPRALMEYLSTILLPRIGGQGVFHDQFAVSHGLLHPPATLLAILLLLGLLLTAWIARRRMPLYAFAVLWFFSGHLIESTVVPLELYFEHRNYLPMLGPLFGLVGAAGTVAIRYRRVAYLFLGIWLLMAASLTAYNATIWGDRGTLAKVWLRENPNSARAMQMVASYEMDSGRTDLARKTLDGGYAKLPGHPELRFQSVLVDCLTEGVSEEQWSELEGLLHTSGDKRTIPDVLAVFGKQAIDGRCYQTMPKGQAERMMSIVVDNPKAGADSRSFLHYELAKLAVASRDLGGVMHHLDKAYALRPNPLIAREQAIYLLTAGLPDDAIRYLDISEHTPYPWFKLWLLDMPTLNQPLRESAQRMKAQLSQRAGEREPSFPPARLPGRPSKS